MYLNHASNYTGRMGPPPVPTSPFPVDPRLEQFPHSVSRNPNNIRADRSNQSGLAFSDRALVSSSSGDLSIPPAPMPGDPEPNALLRFWADQGPWNSQAVAGPEGPQVYGAGMMSHERGRAHPAFVSYREPPKSDPGSHFTGRPSDSGYASKSVLSADYPDQGEENQSLPGDLSSLHVQQPGSRTREYSAGDQQDARSTYSRSNDPRDLTTSTAPTCEYPTSGAVCKSKSDYKYEISPRLQRDTADPSRFRKHSQRHGKPFVCREPDCTRTEGFSTKNDLDRHKKSVHHIVPPNTIDRSFKCAGNNCSKREKIWPRLDNFKSHCTRMHPKEDLDELVKKSEFRSFI